MDVILEKLDLEWTAAVASQDDALAGKILRSKITLLKSSGNLGEHKNSLAEWVRLLEERLKFLPSQVSLTLIGHLRHARKALSLTGSDIGSAFRSEISTADRAKYRKRNRPPKLGVASRADLPEGYANGRPSVHLQPGVLGDGQE